MHVESFNIKFTWQNKQRKILIRSVAVNDDNASFPLYEVYRNNIHLFSVFPVINQDSRKAWEILEKDREPHIPQAFLHALGYMIDGYYVRD